MDRQWGVPREEDWKDWITEHPAFWIVLWVLATVLPYTVLWRTDAIEPGPMFPARAGMAILGLPLAVFLNHRYYRRVTRAERRGLLDTDPWEERIPGSHRLQEEHTDEASGGSRAWVREVVLEHLTPRAATITAVLSIVGLVTANLTSGALGATSVTTTPLSGGWASVVWTSRYLGWWPVIILAYHFLFYYARAWARMGSTVHRILDPERIAALDAPDGPSWTEYWTLARGLTRKLSILFFSGYVQLVFVLLLWGWVSLYLFFEEAFVTAPLYLIPLVTLVAAILYLIGPCWTAERLVDWHREHHLARGMAALGSVDEELQKLAARIQDIDDPILQHREGSPLAAGALLLTSLLNSLILLALRLA